MHKFHHENADRLHDEERRKLLPPEETLISLGLKEGMTMADVGCGPGYFTIPASKIVGKKGKIYAIDVQPEMIEKLIQKNPPENVIPIVAKSDYEFSIADEISDFTFIAFVTHENQDVEKFLSEVKRITKIDGLIAILEWKKQYEEKGPPFEERIEMSELVEKLEKLNLKIIETGGINESHYKIVCAKSKP